MAKTITRLGNLGGAIEYKVILESTSGLKVEANMPPNFDLDLDSNWSQKTGASNAGDLIAGANVNSGRGAAAKSIAGAAAAATGMSGTTMKFLTAHYWDGSSPISCSVPFEFQAERDPETEVIRPVAELLKLGSPEELPGGILIPPGPSIIGSALSGERISIHFGRVLTFDNVVILGVSNDIDTRLDKSDRFFHAKVTVSFRTFYSVSKSDIDKLFKLSMGAR